MESNWLASVGRMNVSGGRVSLDLSLDFCLYYNWFVIREFRIAPMVPRHGAHITICRQTPRANLIRHLHGKKIQFEYSVDILEGGKKKGFRNFWLKVRCPEIDRIKEVLRVDDGENYYGLHLTISSTKAGEVPWQPRMISVKGNVYQDGRDKM